MTNYTPKHQLVDGASASIKFLHSTTKSGVETCLSYCQTASKNVGLFGSVHTPDSGGSAMVQFSYGDDIPTGPPYSFLKGNAGWARVWLLCRSDSPNVRFCVSVVCDDQGSPIRFDMLEGFFKYVTNVATCPPLPASIESHFATEFETHREELFRHLQHKQSVESEKPLRRIRKDLRRIQTERKQIEHRLSELRKILADLRSYPNDSSALDEGTASVSHDSVSSEQIERKSEQTALRQTLLKIEDEELELQASKSSLEQDPQLDSTPLFTIHWAIGFGRLKTHR